MVIKDENEYKAIRDTTPTVVRKITFNNEEELQAGIQAEIDAQLVNHHTIYKFSQLMPINEGEAYAVLTHDLDKVIVSFINITTCEKENAMTEDMLAVMTYPEIECMEKAKILYIGDGMCEIDHFDYSAFTPTWRQVDVFLMDAIEAVEG